MSKKKWLILIALGIAVCVTMAAGAFIAWFMGLGDMVTDQTLPVYTHGQVPSTHPGYRRTTITCGTSVYVNDYDEYALQLQNPDPANAIGRAPFGNAKVCAIPGQEPTAYLAADVGSEMPAYEVFRNSQLPPFDWRHAKFQAMEYAGTIGRTAHKRTTDPALIEDVVRTLRDGTPITSPSLVSGSSSNFHGIYLFSDQLPGLIYCPTVYADPAGLVYLAESFVMENATSTQWTQARWIPASPLFTKWVHTP
jgi:hypothetical protein